jgi:hypothetical protein
LEAVLSKNTLRPLGVKELLEYHSLQKSFFCGHLFKVGCISIQILADVPAKEWCFKAF